MLIIYLLYIIIINNKNGRYKDMSEDYVFFKEKLKEAINNMFKDTIESLTEKEKYSINKKYESICIKFKNLNIAPIINIEEFYDMFLEGKSFDTLLAGLKKTVDNLYMLNIDKDFLLKNVIISAINIKQNIELLPSIPYRFINDTDETNIDIAFVPKLYLDKTHSVVINKDICLNLGLSEEELINTAIKNSEEKLYILKSVSDYFTDLINAFSPEINIDFKTFKNIYILTTDDFLDGAGLIASSKVVEEISKKVNGDFYIIPNSINKLFIFTNTFMYEDFFKDVEEVLKYILIEDDIFLSNNLLYYNSNTKIIENV